MYRICNWQKVQDIYMPFVVNLRHHSNSSETVDPQIHAEQVDLFLPSACSLVLQTTISSLVKKEKKLRLAQAQDALGHLRRLRRILTNIAEFKRTHTSGTGNRSNTRMRTLFDKFQNRIKLAAARYRAAYTILLVLDPADPMPSGLKVLKDEDIRGPKMDDADGFTEGTYEPSWIWLVQGDGNTSEEFSDAMRVEWGKTRARAERWSEEVRLLQEEMRRVLEYCTWKAAWWRSREVERADVDSAVVSGLAAYAEKQAVIWERLGQVFAAKWSAVLKKHQLTADWQTRYSKMPKISSLWQLIEEEADESDREWDDEDQDVVMGD